METASVQGPDGRRGLLGSGVRHKTETFRFAFARPMHVPEKGNVHDFSVREEKIEHIFFLDALRERSDEKLGSGPPRQRVFSRIVWRQMS